MESNSKIIENGIHQKKIKMYSEEDVKRIAWEARRFYHANRDMPFSKIRNEFNEWFKEATNGN